MQRFAMMAIAASALLAGCVSLDPHYERPASPAPEAWPDGPAYDVQSEAAAVLPDWHAFYSNPKLQRLIEMALDGNRDIQIAALNIERARSAYRVQRAQSVPSIEGAIGSSSQQAPAAFAGTDDVTRQYTATVGITAFELDLFGRVRSLNRAALQSYLATEDARDSAQVSLISEVASLYFAYAGDAELLRLAQDTFDAQQASLTLTQRRHEAGASSLLDVRRAQTIVESARADVARYTTLVAQDENALSFLIGGAVPEELRPTSLDEIQFAADALQAGVPSEVLLTRPDIRAAEHELRAANANIGAARAAFFPSVSIAGYSGQVDNDFEALFNGAGDTWSFTPRVTIPIFSGGARLADLGVREADRDIAVARYEQSIQIAFREVADALAEHGTIGEQVSAREALAEATRDTYRISEARYRQGIDSYLSVLDAQRELYGAEQALVGVRVQRAVNFATLYKTLGGGVH
jgi:multidrug efflux system outer membrane protein